jgi:hypothetical protein
MSYGVLRGSRLRFSKFGGALLAVTGFLAGCDDTKTAQDGDAGDAGTGFVSADPRGDGGVDNIDTQNLSVGLDTSQAPDNLSVGLDPFADAGVTETSAPATSAASSSEVVQATSAEPADTSVPPADTSVAPIDTSVPPADTSVATDTSSTGDTSAPREVLELAMVSEASWVDLPVTARADGLPDINLEFTWRVTSVPDGSEVGDWSLSDTTASEANFHPDVAGSYTLSLHLESDSAVGDGEVTVDVAKVDVGFLQFSDGGDGYYAYEPKMVRSDVLTGPVVVGCPFYSWDFEDATFWRYALSEKSRTIGFSYPREPGDETLFAYQFRDAYNGYYGVTHVGDATSDCVDNRPADLHFGFDPDFSPSAADLSRIDRSDGTYLLSSPVDVNDVAYPTDSSSLQASDWWDDRSIAWSGNAYNSETSVYGYVVAISAIDSEDYQTVLDCTLPEGEIPQFDPYESPIEKLAVVPGGLLAKSLGQLWYLPVTIEEGSAYASCESGFEGNLLLANGVADFEVAPDGRTLAVITEQYGDGVSAMYLGVGPVGEAFYVGNPLWQAYELSPTSDSYNDYYTGLHWIADSQQLIWTAIQYETDAGDGFYYTYIYDSAVYKINADGTHRRTLVYNTFDAPNQLVVTTGPVDLAYSYD